MTVHYTTNTYSNINSLLIPITLEIIKLNPYKSELISNHIYYYFLECINKVVLWKAYEYSIYEILSCLDIEYINISRETHIRLSNTYELYIEIGIESIIQSGNISNIEDYTQCIYKIPGIRDLDINYKLLDNRTIYTSLELDVISISKLDSLYNLGIPNIQRLMFLYNHLLSNHINKEHFFQEIEHIGKSINMELEIND